MKKLAPLVVIGLIAGAALVAPAPAAAAPPSSQYTLVWSDEFNGTAVDTAKWNHRTDIKGWSAQRAQNVTVGGGLMTIHLKKESFGGKAYTGGGLVSKTPFRYGYYETRVKTNVGSGWHSAFWTLKGNGVTSFPPDRRTEIDGFEIDSHQPERLRHNVIPWKPNGTYTPITSGVYDLLTDTSAAFHTYGFEWTETQVRYFVDGVFKYAAPYSPFCCTQHDWTNVWLTAIAIDLQGSPGVDESSLPGQVQWDYFRYYAKDGYTDNEGPTAYRYSETGAWVASSLIGHTLENTSRYTTTAGSTATWGAWVPAAGTYDVYVYKIVNVACDTNSRFDITHAGGTATVHVDYCTGSNGWVKLGTWSFAQGESGSVKLVRDNGYARADAVKFIRV
ncbi:MAG TPA: glycoside hydrolase family 16 protein [Candidatus Limnocylindrales bacterium]